MDTVSGKPMALYPDGTYKEKSSDRLVFCSVPGTSTPTRGAANFRNTAPTPLLLSRLSHLSSSSQQR